MSFEQDKMVRNPILGSKMAKKPLFHHFALSTAHEPVNIFLSNQLHAQDWTLGYTILIRLTIKIILQLPTIVQSLSKSALYC
jgi:hypothetical protein